jgi:hypothetical protein
MMAAANKKPTVLPRWVFCLLNLNLACASLKLESVTHTNVEQGWVNWDSSHTQSIGRG